MEKHFKLLSVAIILVVLSSCTGKGGIPEVKLIPVKSGAEFEYIDKEGKIMINPQFEEASVFRNGIALVKTSGKDAKWGFIDEKGSYVINPKYKYATVFNEGLAWVVVENGAPTAINEKGEIKITLKNAEDVRLFSEGLAAFSTVDKDGKKKWGFIDKNGNVKINPQFDQVSRFSESKCAVANEERKWGYIDDNGKISINYQFNNAQDFSNGRAVVSSDDKYGVIGKDGKYIINPQFEYMMNDGEWFVIDQNDKWGWCDANGKIIINPQFANVCLFLNNKLAPVQSGDQWGYVDKEGKIFINPQFKAAKSFSGNLALVYSSDKIGFINEEGKYIINPQFSDISSDYTQYLSGGTMYGSVETDIFNAEAVITFNHNLIYGSVTDIDGNIYKTITIGTQTWMAENLRTTKYRNGVAIPNVTDSTAWTSLTTGAWCNYNNDASNVQRKYGKLYNWYAATDSRNIAPTGWHVPFDAEWSTLTTYLGGEAVAGDKLKETGTCNWLNPNTGATNETGFSALPGGVRSYGDGTLFGGVGYRGYWWSATEGSTSYAWLRYIYYTDSGVYRGGYDKTDGFSVRCVRDN
jgi:uncharacterized protein (TIGR02145 family)